MTTQASDHRFSDSRYGLFIHYGLFSLLGRGEWVWNKENIPYDEYTALAHEFRGEHFDAEALCDLAVCAGMRYVVFTTMHHEGFRLYDTDLSDFNSVKMAGRDLTAEIITAARKRNLKVALYHSLNNWKDKPDAVDALESSASKTLFIQNTFSRIRELVTRYQPIDVLWYDGWWPFNAEGWEAEKMNTIVREIQPHILFNGRNGLPGDFATPEGHMAAPKPWRPWEACMTLNKNWGFHHGDQNWKTPGELIDLLISAAQGRGNLLMNVGLKGDGSVPLACVDILKTVGGWLERGGSEALWDTEVFTFDLQEKGTHRGEWSHHGNFTAKGNTLYWLVRNWPGSDPTFGGLETKVTAVERLGITDEAVSFKQTGGRLQLSGQPQKSPDPLCSIFKITCEAPPMMYQCGGLRVPKGPHPRYDPCPSDIQH